jgi:formylglycine-generating enzyme required for sulfatase activity
MQRWFLSYNTQDMALMQALEQALRQRDPDAHIFFAPKSLRAGGYWLPELAKEIAASTAFVLLVGENGIGQWQVIEYYDAFDRRVKDPGYPVILILQSGRTAPGLPFLQQLHRIVTTDPSSEDAIGRLLHAADGTDTQSGELWRYAAPYRGLAAMTVSDSDFFFGRDRETAEVIQILAGAPGKLPILLGNSGVGKSSLAQAGILAALLRQGFAEHAANSGSWPHVFHDSRHWCFLAVRPGTEPLKALVEAFLETWQLDRTTTEWPERRAEWVEKLLAGRLTLQDLLDQSERRYAEVQRPKPPMFFLYIDQGEELYVRADDNQRRRFSEVLARGLSDQRLRVLMSMRSDFLGALQNDSALFAVHRQINVPPLHEEELREVVSRPAQALAARFETPELAGDIARRTAEDSAKDAGALPLLSYLLDDMWTQMVKRGDGVLRLPMQAIALGGVLVERANAFLAHHPHAEDSLRRLFTLRLATVRPDGEPMRRRAPRSEFSDEEWRLVTELADHPNRLLVTATLNDQETYAEVAHEAIFGRWDKLREWIASEREFLAWRSSLEAARRAWEGAPDAVKKDALLMGLALSQAQSWLAKRGVDLTAADRKFISFSAKTAQRRRLRAQTVFAGLAFAIIVGVAGWLNQAYLLDRWRWYTVVRPHMMKDIRPFVLTAAAERALKPLDTFRECAKDCPEMVVIPAGKFMMGSPETEKDRNKDEGPQHEVVIGKPFAVSKYELTFDAWDACVAYGDCRSRQSDSPTDRARRPVINVTWEDAQGYVAWLSRMTGKHYRLLTEAEWEYAARAGSATAFSFGDDESKVGQFAWYAGNSNGLTQEVGKKLPNAFGLYDMYGNAWEWVEDCWHNNYRGAPTDGSAWTTGDCSHRVVRGGSGNNVALLLRSANRGNSTVGYRVDLLGCRVARSLDEADKR